MIRMAIRRYLLGRDKCLLKELVALPEERHRVMPTSASEGVARTAALRWMPHHVFRTQMSQA